MDNKEQLTLPARLAALLRALLLLLVLAAAWMAGLLFLGTREVPPVAPAPVMPPPRPASAVPAVPASAVPAAPRHPAKAGRAFRDCAACPEMVALPPGSFAMGDAPDTHRVTLAHGYAIGRYEVTQSEWQALMGNNPSHFKGARLPVEHVSWDDVQAYLFRLSRKTGQHYRLPSEAEWEYACRAGGADDYCGGNDADSVAWYGALGGAGGNSGGTTHPVGGKQPNAFGLYDMSGNVWEWVQDPWHPGYAGAPADGRVWAGNGAKRVIRGGSWLDYPLLARAAYRIYAGTAKRSSDLGFRVARELPRRGR